MEVTNARAVGSRVDTLNLVIVRWLDTHPRACERDDLGRPLCPGPLSINNCLWTYARSATPRRSMVQPCGAASRSFNIYRQMFGATGTEQRECWTREKHAYFGFVTPCTCVILLKVDRPNQISIHGYKPFECVNSANALLLWLIDCFRNSEILIH